MLFCFGFEVDEFRFCVVVELFSIIRIVDLVGVVSLTFDVVLLDNSFVVRDVSCDIFE